MRDWLVNLPDELTESDLIDMVEGTLSSAREPVAIAALKAEPRLGLLIKQMRMDKAALAGVHDEHAPEALADSVLAQIDARVLRALAAEAQEHAAGIPVHTVLIDDGPQARAVIESRMFRFSALAAAAVLVGGSVTAYIVHELNVAARRRPPGPVAVAPAPVNTAAPETNPDSTVSDGTGAPGDLPLAGGASTEPSADRPSDAPSLSLDITAAPAPAQAPEGVAGTSRTADPAPPPPLQPTPALAETTHEPELSLPAAARYMREGRLAIVVKPRDAGAAVKRLDTLARIGAQAPSTSRRDLEWRALDIFNLPAQYAALATPSTQPAPADDPASPSVPPTIAGDRGVAEPGIPQVAPIQSPSLPSSRPAVKAIYAVEIEPTERGLNELTRIIGEPGAVQSFRVLKTPIVEAVSLDPGAVLWWAGSPTRWIKPAIVPVVIEGRE